MNTKEKPSGILEIEDTFRRICKGETFKYLSEWFKRANITLCEYTAYSTDGLNTPHKQAQAYIKDDVILFSFDENGICNNVSIY